MAGITCATCGSDMDELDVVEQDGLRFCSEECADEYTEDDEAGDEGDEDEEDGGDEDDENEAEE